MMRAEIVFLFSPKCAFILLKPRFLDGRCCEAVDVATSTTTTTTSSFWPTGAPDFHPNYARSLCAFIAKFQIGREDATETTLFFIWAYS